MTRETISRFNGRMVPSQKVLVLIALMTAFAAFITAMAPLVIEWAKAGRDNAPVISASMELVDGLRTELERQRILLSDATSRIDRLEDRNDQLMENVSGLTNKLAELQVENKQLVLRIEELSKENALLKSQIQDLTRQIQILTAENAKLIEGPK